MASRPIVDPNATGEASALVAGFKFIQFEVVNFIAKLTLNHAPHNVLTIPMSRPRFQPAFRSKIPAPIACSRLWTLSRACSRP